MHIIEMILLISALIIVHEAGHFFVARVLGIRVDKVGFGLPIGPTFFEKKVVLNQMISKMIEREKNEKK